MPHTKVKLTSRYTTIDGLRIHYIESPPLATPSLLPPLLMLAGWPMAGFMLTPLTKYFAAHTKCYILDLPGYGGSESDEKAFCGFDYYLDFIHKFHTKIIKIPKISIFGYSTGGVHALNYAGRYPDQVDRLITFSAPYDGTEQFAEMAVRSPKRLKTLKVLYPLVAKHPKLVRLVNYRIFKFMSIGIFYLAVYTRLYPKAIERCEKRFMLQFLHKTSKFNVKTIFDLAMDLSNTDYSHKAKMLETPTLIISASNDTTVKPYRSKKLAKLIPNNIYHLVEDADHAVGVVHPEKISSVVLQFLSGKLISNQLK